MTYKEFYRTYGIRFVRDFLSPLVWSSDVLEFPKQTMLFWLSGTGVKEYPTRDFGYFKNLHKPAVYTVLKYSDNAILGSPKERTVNEGKLVRLSKLREPSFRYLKGTKEINLPATSELLFNLGFINSGYKYTASPLTPYNVWHNSLTTAVDMLKLKRTGANRQKYIFINLPSVIPDRLIINKYLGVPTRNTLKHFTDYTYLNVLELFRFISDEHKIHSILANNLTEDEFKYINLVLTINNKSTIINLEVLASIADTYSIETVIKKYPSNVVNKVLYIFLNKILEAAPLVTTTEVTGVELPGVVSVDIDTTPTVDEVNLDQVITNELADSDQIVVDETVEESIDNDIKTIATEKIVSMKSDNEPIAIDMATEITDNSNLVTTLQKLAASKIITKKTSSDLANILADQATKSSPYSDGTKLKDMLTYTEDEVMLDTASVNINNSPTVFDKSSNNDRLKVLTDTYRKQTMKKDILSTIYSIQKAGVVIKDHEIIEQESILGKTEEHKLTIQTLAGGKSTVRIILPVVGQDNTITLSGNKYFIRTQRADIPVKKISNSIVSLNSYYGKLFITRSYFKKDDLGFWFHKQLINMYGVDNELKDVAAVSVTAPDSKTPPHYGLIGRYVKSFTYKGYKFNFDYSAREKVFSSVKLNLIEKNRVVVAMKGKQIVVMDNKNQLSIVDSDNQPLGTVFEFLNMDTTKAPIEYCNAKIYKKQIPVAVLLSYYLGYTKLLDLLDVKYTVIDTGKRVSLLANQYRIVFKDKTYIITRDYGVGDLIVAGFKSLATYTKKISVTSLDKSDTFVVLFAAMELPILYVNEIKLMEDMFIDPITKQVLELFKFPVTFRGVLVKAVELLQDDNYRHPNHINGAVLKGYERISGMIYLELVKSLRANSNKSYFSKGGIVFNPYSVLNKINEDSTTVLVDDLNPIAILKQHEDVTYLGSHGRKEETMSEATRIIHQSEIGIISGGVKDSGAVGISAYLTASPKLETTRGTVGSLDKSDGWASRLTTSSMLAPFATKDDPKRKNFINIMNAHVIPMQNMEPPYIRTGYETTLAVKASSNFVISAIADGVVSSVSKDNLSVLYKEIGKKTYKLKEWTSKEEAGVTYTHKLVANVKKGDSFLKDASLAYDKSFFEPDIFDPTRVIYKSGTSLTVALMESPETYEDSGAISAKVAKLMSTVVTKVKSITLTNTDSILNPIANGDKVEPKTPLLSIADTALSTISNLDDKAIEILKTLRLLTPKASYRGTVSKVRVYYNCEFDELSTTIKKLAKESDIALLNTTGFTGKVNSSYSIQGVPLPIGGVEIKYYINVVVSMGTGDKAILGNQLKFTVGDVYKEPMLAEDGTVIDGIFSAMSIEARIVNSPGLIGTTSKVLEVLADNAIEMYFK